MLLINWDVNDMNAWQQKVSRTTDAFFVFLAWRQQCVLVESSSQKTRVLSTTNVPRKQSRWQSESTLLCCHINLSTKLWWNVISFLLESINYHQYSSWLTLKYERFGKSISILPLQEINIFSKPQLTRRMFRARIFWNILEVSVSLQGHYCGNFFFNAEVEWKNNKSKEPTERQQIELQTKAENDLFSYETTCFTLQQHVHWLAGSFHIVRVNKNLLTWPSTTSTYVCLVTLRWVSTIYHLSTGNCCIGFRDGFDMRLKLCNLHNIIAWILRTASNLTLFRVHKTKNLVMDRCSSM